MTRLRVLTVIAVIASGGSPAGPSAPTTTATTRPPTPPSVPALATTPSGTVLAITPGGTTLSDRVYYVAPDGVRPWPHTRVVYKSIEGPWYDVYQASDDDGRFAFGRLPLGLGQPGAVDCNDQLQFQTVVIRGDTVSDVDVTPLVTKCLGIPR